METFVDQKFSKIKLKQLNACRMYLQVTTLAEISDHTGTELLHQAFPSTTQNRTTGLAAISMSTLKWPHVELPSPTCWRIWSTTVRTLYTGSRTGTRLQQPLGEWLSTYQQQRFWKWRLYDPEHLLFQNSPAAPTRVALKTQQRRTMLKFSPTIPTNLDFTGPPRNTNGYKYGLYPDPGFASPYRPSSRTWRNSLLHTTKSISKRPPPLAMSTLWFSTESWPN